MVQIRTPKENETSAVVEIRAPVGKKPTEEYDPYDHGNEKHATTFLITMIHLLKGIIGGGILALPFIFKNVGYVNAIVGMLFISALYTHTIHILLSVEYELCKRLKTPNLTYVNVVRNAFDTGPPSLKFGKPFGTFILYLQYVFNGTLGGSSYILIIASNFKTIVDHYGSVDSSITVFATLTVLPLLLLGCIPNFKYLAPFTTLTNVFNAINIILILCIPGPVKSFGQVEPFSDVTEFPSFFAISIGALTATGLMLPLKSEMKNPKQFSQFFGALNIAGFVVTVIYILFGFTSYMRYGNNTRSNILLNLPPHNTLSLLVRGLYSFSVCVSYTIFLFVHFDTIWSNYLKAKTEKHPYQYLIPYALKTTLTLISYAVTVTIPNFGLIVSISGTVSFIVELGIPPLLQILVLLSKDERNLKVYLLIAKDTIMIIFTLCLFVVGVVKVIHKLVNFFNGDIL